MLTPPALVHYTAVQAATRIPNPEREAGGIGGADGREAVLWDQSGAPLSAPWGPFSPSVRPSGPLQYPPPMSPAPYSWAPTRSPESCCQVAMSGEARDKFSTSRLSDTAN